MRFIDPNVTAKDVAFLDQPIPVLTLTRVELDMIHAVRNGTVTTPQLKHLRAAYDRNLADAKPEEDDRRRRIFLRRRYDSRLTTSPAREKQRTRLICRVQSPRRAKGVMLATAAWRSRFGKVTWLNAIGPVVSTIRRW